MMTLKQYLQEKRIRQTAFARSLGVSDCHVSELVNGQKRPGLQLAVKIERATGGAVPAVSWYGYLGGAE